MSLWVILKFQGCILTYLTHNSRPFIYRLKPTFPSESQNFGALTYLGCSALFKSPFLASIYIFTVLLLLCSSPWFPQNSFRKSFKIWQYYLLHEALYVLIIKVILLSEFIKDFKCKFKDDSVALTISCFIYGFVFIGIHVLCPLAFKLW